MRNKIMYPHSSSTEDCQGSKSFQEDETKPAVGCSV